MTRKITGSVSFKRGSIYDRITIWEHLYPGVPVPSGGDWFTGYALADNYENLIVFMNIGVPGKTGDDYDNYYDDKNNTIKWFGKPESHSNQPIFKKLLNHEIKAHFFARWNNKSKELTYLGIGAPIEFKDNIDTKQGPAIQITLTCKDVNEILNYGLVNYDDEIKKEDRIKPQQKGISSVSESSFLYEKHLEDYIQKKWNSISLSEEYDFVERQCSTDTGPLDILAKRKDQKEYLVIELKRDMASDAVIGQTLRYMGYIKKKYCNDGETVKGCIITNSADPSLRNALSVIDNIEILTYKISFNLEKMEIT